MNFVLFFLNGCFPKWWYPTTMGFPTKNDHFGMFWGYHHLTKHPNVILSLYSLLVAAYMCSFFLIKCALDHLFIFFFDICEIISWITVFTRIFTLS